MKRLILLSIILCVVMLLFAQDTTYPFECVPTISNPDMPARNIWIGYNNGGWDVPKDTRLVYRYNRQWVNTYRVYYSKLADEYYLFVYDTEPIDEGKGYWSWHPCGQGAITPQQYAELITNE